MREKGFTVVLFVLILAILSTGIVGTAYYLKSLQAKQVILENNPKPTEVAANLQSTTPFLAQTPSPKMIDQELQSCFDESGRINCPEGYTCDYSQPGGMTPQGYQTGAASGDGQCHKSCQTDNDCTPAYPRCITKQLTGGDIVTNSQFCSKE
ncbi:MAG: hypothetical protein NUV73_00625 [Candidatus Daviesbacteria bacterium]|nr:hypothetical protein [Candidatus Daviesbacteria bacterium]